jgi:hypothetical protein
MPSALLTISFFAVRDDFPWSSPVSTFFNHEIAKSLNPAVLVLVAAMPR